MSIIKKKLFLSLIITVIFTSQTFAENLKKVGKYKDWEVMVMSETIRKSMFCSINSCFTSSKKK